MKLKVTHSCLTLLRPHGPDNPWNTPGQNTGVGSLSLLQGIFPTQGQYPGLPYRRHILYHLKLVTTRMFNYLSIALISHASTVMLKILQARLQQYVNRENPDGQAGFRKGRGTRDQIANICWIMKKQESSRKTSISALWTMPKPLTVWITINCGKF